MELNLEGHRVIVTAGAAGIGLEVARAFTEEGARVWICDVDAGAVEGLAGSDPGITAEVCDVTDREGVAAFVGRAAAGLGGLDCLVNNAGTAGATALVEDTAPEDWDRCVEVCLTGQYNFAHHAAPLLRKSANASIVNFASAAGKYGFAMRTAYAAAKWGVVGFTKSLAIEMGGDGVRVNAILPGIVAGDRQRRVLEAKAQQLGLSFGEVEAMALSNASVKDYVTARQIADQVLLLASERGRTISGQAISIDGDLKMLT